MRVSLRDSENGFSWKYCNSVCVRAQLAVIYLESRGEEKKVVLLWLNLNFVKSKLELYQLMVLRFVKYN